MSGIDYLLHLSVIDNSGRQYSLSLPSYTTLENLKEMAINYFMGQVEGKITTGHSGGSSSGSGICSNGSNFRLLLLRGTRTLNDDASTLHSEKLINSDTLLLVPRRTPPPPPKDLPLLSPTQTQIDTATDLIEKRNENSYPSLSLFSVDPDLVSIWVTLIKSSVRLISADPNPNNNEMFINIFEKLEERKIIWRINLKFRRQLLQMGFDKVRVNEALLSQKNMELEEALDWLLDDRNGPAIGSNSRAHLSIENITTQREDPEKVFFKEFIRYMKRWFTSNENALNMLVEKIEKSMPSSPITAALLASSLIRKGLFQPKHLLGILTAIESSGKINVNQSLSDVDLNRFVSHIFEIIESEKHLIIDTKK